MKNRIDMNGTDYLMSVFDLQMRKSGFAGNLSHIILETPASLDPARLRARLARLTERFPILCARRRRAFWPPWPYWQLPAAGTAGPPEVSCLRSSAPTAAERLALYAGLLNQPLPSERGALVRFHLIENASGGGELIMTWNHALMDIHGAETFLAMAGGDDELLSAGAQADAAAARNFYTRQINTVRPWWVEAKASLAVLRWLEPRSHPPPISLAGLRPRAIRPQQNFLFLEFSEQETAAITELIGRHCGYLSETAYYLAAMLLETHRLYAACGAAPENYILIMPTNARPKGVSHPVFSNFESFLVYQFAGDQRVNFTAAVNAVQTQTRDTLRCGLTDSFVAFDRMARLVPPNLYWKRMRMTMQGEIGSFFFSNTGNVSPRLRQFMGQTISRLWRAPSVIAPPGFGSFFYKFGGRLACTVAYAAGLLSREEAAGFAARLRTRLLDPELT